MVSGQGHGKQGIPMTGSPYVPGRHCSQEAPVVDPVQLIQLPVFGSQVLLKPLHWHGSQVFEIERVYPIEHSSHERPL